MANWLIEKTIDLRVPKTSRVDDLEPAHALTVVGDDRGHVWRVTVLDGGQPATLTGSVVGWFQRADGNTVVVAGTLDGNTASVTLADACCAVEGPMVGIMRISGASKPAMARSVSQLSPAAMLASTKRSFRALSTG